MAPKDRTSQAERKTPIAKRLRRVGVDVLIDLALLTGFLLTLWMGSLLVELLFHGSLLFGKYEKSYLFDAADVALVICFTIRGGRRLLNQP